MFPLLTSPGPDLTRIAVSLQSSNRRVRPRLVWRNGTLLASPVVHGVTGHFSSCVWYLRVSADDTRGCQCPFVLCLHQNGYLQRGVRALGSYQEQTGKSRSFSGCVRKPCVPSTCAGDLRELLRVPLRSRDTVDLGGASRASTVFGVMEEGLISSGVRNLRVPLHFGLRSQGPFRVGTGESGLVLSGGMELCLPLQLFTG